MDRGYRSAELTAAPVLRITFAADELGERFKQGVRDASALQMERGDDCWQRDGEGSNRGRWLQTRDGVRFAPDDHDIHGPLGFYIAGGLFAIASMVLAISYVGSGGIGGERETVLAVLAAVALFLGVSLLNAGRVHYTRAKRSPRGSGLYLFHDALLDLDHYRRASIVPKDRLIDVTLRQPPRQPPHLEFRYQGDNDGATEALRFGPATEHSLAMAQAWLKGAD